MKIAEIISVVVNEVCGGEPKHTLCYQAYKNHMVSKKYYYLYKLINFCCFWEKNHCRKIYLMEKKRDDNNLPKM